MFFSSAHLSVSYILYLEINKVVSIKILCKNMDGINFFFLSGLRDQNFGENGAQVSK